MGQRVAVTASLLLLALLSAPASSSRLLRPTAAPSTAAVRRALLSPPPSFAATAAALDATLENALCPLFIPRVAGMPLVRGGCNSTSASRLCAGTMSHVIRRNVSKEASFDIEGASQDTGWPGDDERRGTASKAWPRILCAIAAGAILLQVAYVMPNPLSSEPVVPTHSAFAADVPLAGSEYLDDDGEQQESAYAERMRKKEEERVRKLEEKAGHKLPVCIDTKSECREWAKHSECARNWHFMHTGCQLSCSQLPGYADAFACRQPTSAEAADTAKAEQQAARDAIKAAEEVKKTAAAEAKKRRAAADAARAEQEAAAKRQFEEEAAARRQAAADAARAEEEAAAKRRAEEEQKRRAEEEQAQKQAAAAIFSEEQKVAANDAAPAACADSSAKCADWAKSGECDSNPGFMHKTCAKSCGKC